VTVHRWVERFTLILIDAVRPCWHIVGDRWVADETSFERILRRASAAHCLFHLEDLT